jgi:hypothetical protein
MTERGSKRWVKAVVIVILVFFVFSIAFSMVPWWVFA